MKVKIQTNFDQKKLEILESHKKGNIKFYGQEV